ncbi:Putative transposase [Candidatus Protochlamydia naegleriophila]|uniref:Putative transposase n=2 Tax=Candidatus Protochlamydia naegleriophila TaxID=389348 RepID=A0A0U5JG14_9BACT|nr:Putative transposase [Candidatus Protochlamydia naegleriophila]
MQNYIKPFSSDYIDAVIQELRKNGKSVRDENIARLSLLVYDHVNMLGRYSFDIPDSVFNGGLRLLHDSLGK